MAAGIQEKTIHFLDYLKILSHHKWVILSSLVIMVVLTVVHNFEVTPIYRSTATIIVDGSGGKSPLTGRRLENQGREAESLAFFSHFELITSREVLEEVVQRLDLGNQTWSEIHRKIDAASPVRQFLSKWKWFVLGMMGIQRQVPQEVDVTEALVGKLDHPDIIRIDHVKETRLIRVRAYVRDPELAKDIANTLAQSYIDYNINNRLQSSQNTMNWLTQHLAEAKTKLENAEAEFQDYKQREKLISIEDSQRGVVQKISEFNNAYIQARNRRLDLDTKLSRLKKLRLSGKDIRHLRSLVGSATITDLYNESVDVDLELSRLAKVFKSKHPKVVQADTRRKNIRIKLKREVEKEIENLETERNVLRSRERVLLSTVDGFEMQAMQTNQKALNYNILKRNVEMNQNLYDTLLSRLKEANLLGNLNLASIRIVEKARASDYPVWPNKTRNLIVGILLGLFIGIGAGFLWEYFDRSLYTEEDVQQQLNLPVLAVIPSFSEQSRRGGTAAPRDNG